MMFLNIIQILAAPRKKIVVIEEVPFSWCDEDYPITDLNDTYLADDAADDDVTLEEISY